MTGRVIPGLALLAVLLSTAVAHADEIRLKDGTKITGTIVGFQDDSFRVETAYGFALIRKDKVADINITPNSTAPKPESKLETKPVVKPEVKPEAKPEAKKDLEPKTKSGVPQSSPPAAAPSVVAAVAKESVSAANSSSALNDPVKDPLASGANASSVAMGGSEVPKAKLAATASIPPPPAAPPPPPEPPVIRDEIRGNLYVNLTYGFQMYKPPSWEMIPGARKALPDAVAALGTYDQTTLLVIGREHAKDSLDAHATATGKALDGVYDNYRVITNKDVSIAGLPAVEQRARGTADGHDWSVVLVTFLKSGDAYTLLGMTWADSDLIQVQENVIEKAVNSLTFAGQ